MIKEAYHFAHQAHEGKLRFSGESSFFHPFAVAKILVEEWRIKEENFIIAALLHDVAEDSQITLSEIASRFGKEVAELVDGVTKLRSESEETEDRETLRKIIGKSYLNPSVAVIKLADRLHNMRTLEFMPPEKQLAKAEETLKVYTGLAESLGLWLVKTELEDLSFKFIDPEGYKKIKEEVDQDPRLSPLFIAYLQTDLERLLLENEITGKVAIAKEGYWALREKRKKLALAGKCTPDKLREINDLISFRVIVDSEKSCYLALQAIHAACGEKVDYERFDEFIGANVRLNGYSALQTTLNFKEGAVEIAIVSQEMEEFNNWGVVSLIKRGKKNLQDYVLKLVFTPSGEVKFLPKEATAIDFAYAINPRLGAEASSVLIDGKEMPLSTVVPNSAVVEIVVGLPRRAPDPELIKYSLPPTKRIIEQQLRIAERDKLVKAGQIIIREILLPRGIILLTDVREKINDLLYRLGCQGVDDLYFKLGGGYVSPELISSELDKSGITKEKLGLTSIEATGKDEPGIFQAIASAITERKGNIVNIVLSVENGQFDIRLVVESFIGQEDSLRDFLAKDGRFINWIVV